jgi:trans-aconitate 2-methyltransferase
MAWNPETYNKFKSERFTPFYDLLALVNVKPSMNVIDLGCGTGELTKKLADHLPGSTVLGIDSSPEMLSKSVGFAGGNIRFECESIERKVKSGEKWDLVFSNAAIQWVDNHKDLIPQIISCVKEGGQLLIQIPSQQHNRTNKMLNDLANEEPFRTSYKNWNRISPVLEVDEYGRIFFDNGCKTMTLYEKIYPLILPDTEALYDWVSGTALIPYLERLNTEEKNLFITEYKKRLQKYFSGIPVFYAFKRIIMEASF